MSSLWIAQRDLGGASCARIPSREMQQDASRRYYDSLEARRPTEQLGLVLLFLLCQTVLSSCTRDTPRAGHRNCYDEVRTGRSSVCDVTAPSAGALPSFPLAF